MNLEEILKKIKLNESTISTMLGVAVVVVIGVLVVNFFRGQNGDTNLPGTNTEVDNSLPTNHTVQKGESLWDIAQIHYKSGYNWVSIAEANNLSNPNSLEEGQSLIIPNVEPITLAQSTSSPSPEPAESAGQSAAVKEVLAQDNQETLSEEVESYVVQKGDNLWSIAESVYNDGFQWTKIAEANNLSDPGTIHAGNVFTIPQ